MDKILICGKTSLFSREALQYISEAHDVFLAGKRADRGDGDLPANVRVFPLSPADSDFQKVFEAGRIRAVWYVSGCADGGRPVQEDMHLAQVLRLCARYRVPRCIVLTESTDPTDYRQLHGESSSAQGDWSSVETAVCRLPLLTGTGTPRGRLMRIFSALQAGKTLILEGEPGMELSVLPMQELTAMLLRMTDETWFREGIYAADGSGGRLEDLREVLLSIRPDALIEYSETRGKNRGAGGKGRKLPSRTAARFRIPVCDRENCDGNLGEMYRLPVSIDRAREISVQYQQFVESGARAKTPMEKLSGFLRESGKWIGAVLDLVIMFLIAEYLGRITSDSVYFKIVDVRLLFVVLMGMMHGLAIGFAAAAMECVMLVIRYSGIGISGLLLFYNVENWIPFVYYLTAGVISGYTHQKNRQEIRSVRAENALIRNKYLYLLDAYQESVDDRRELRTQILSEEESYAKVFDAVRGMSRRTPEAVSVEAVRILRNLLDNETVFIYEMDPDGKRAQLLSCCRENTTRRSLTAQDCPEMTEVIRAGKTWKNERFLDGAPMYAYRVQYDRALQQNRGDSRTITLVVTVEKASMDQLSLWYMNHFTILCELFRDALEHAALRERVQV